MVASISGFSSFNVSEISQRRQNLFNMIDQSGDGSISKTEMQAILQDNGTDVEDVFAKLDTDSDTAISKQEFDDAMAKLHQEMKQGGAGGVNVTSMPPPPNSDNIFNSIDQDSDGYITATELKTAHATDGVDTDALLSKIDTDSDGKISKSESDVFLSQETQSKTSGAIASGAPPPPQGGETDSDELFSKLDTNQDGTISKTEWDAAQQNTVAKTQSGSLTDISASSDMMSRLIEAILAAYSNSDTASSLSNSLYA